MDNLPPRAKRRKTFVSQKDERLRNEDDSFLDCHCAVCLQKQVHQSDSAIALVSQSNLNTCVYMNSLLKSAPNKSMIPNRGGHSHRHQKMRRNLDPVLGCTKHDRKDNNMKHAGRLSSLYFWQCALGCHGCAPVTPKDENTKTLERLEGCEHGSKRPEGLSNFARK